MNRFYRNYCVKFGIAVDNGDEEDEDEYYNYNYNCYCCDCDGGCNGNGCGCSGRITLDCVLHKGQVYWLTLLGLYTLPLKLLVLHIAIKQCS